MINEKVKKNQKTGLHGPVLVYFIPMTTTTKDKIRSEGFQIGRAYVEMVNNGETPLLLADWVSHQAGSIMDNIADDRLNVSKTLQGVEGYARDYIMARTNDTEFVSKLRAARKQ